MKRELMDILACPICKGDLELSITEEDERGEIVHGSLYCKKCDERYPIEDGIPNLLPPELRRSGK
ncbi:MAG: Trm112 family protein [Methanophagales archaeon ANME-1-THS]|nr:MAG: Trm112 family protein [Methanophagales archaeon ANME-1-THS]